MESGGGVALRISRFPCAEERKEAVKREIMIVKGSQVINLKGLKVQDNTTSHGAEKLDVGCNAKGYT